MPRDSVSLLAMLRWRRNSIGASVLLLVLVVVATQINLSHSFVDEIPYIRNEIERIKRFNATFEIEQFRNRDEMPTVEKILETIMEQRSKSVDSSTCYSDLLAVYQEYKNGITTDFSMTVLTRGFLYCPTVKLWTGPFDGPGRKIEDRPVK